MEHPHISMVPMRASFVEFYLIKGNATWPAAQAGYSSASAYSQGSRLLKDDEIRAALTRRRAEMAQQAKITPEMIVRELALIAFSDMAAFASWKESGMKLTDSGDLPPGASRIMAELSETVTEHGGSTRFKLHNKQQALDSLAKILGMYSDKDRLPAGGGAPIVVREVIVNLSVDPGQGCAWAP